MGNRRFVTLASLALVLILVAAPFARGDFIGTVLGAPSGGSRTPAGVQPPGPIFVTGNGGDIWGTADGFHYYHDAWSGDFNAVVRFVNMAGGSDGWRKAGIMARADTTPGAIHTWVSATPQRTCMQWRDSTGGDSGWPEGWLAGSPGAGAAPYWLLLTRRANAITARWAPDVGGSPGAWSAPGTHTSPNMPADIQVGLAVTSHSPNQLTTVEFDNFQVGNWEAHGELGVAGCSVVGKAFGRDRDTGAVLGPAHWKIEREVPISISGDGILNEWFDNETFTEPTVVFPFATDRVDRASGVFPPELGWSGDQNNFFSVRYTAEFYADHDGTYSFEEHVDDEAWLFIDGTQILHDGQWDVATTGSLELTEGWHDLEFRTREGFGGDNARLQWDPAGGTAFEVMTTDNALFRYSYEALVVEFLAEGTGNVGDLLARGDFDLMLDHGHHDLVLTVDYLRETMVVRDSFRVPEPATCALFGLGLLAIVRRRRRRT